MIVKSGTLLAPEDRAEIASLEAVQLEENRRRQRLCHQGWGGDEAFASSAEDVRNVAALGDCTPRQQASERWRQRVRDE